MPLVLCEVVFGLMMPQTSSCVAAAAGACRDTNGSRLDSSMDPIKGPVESCHAIGLDGAMWRKRPLDCTVPGRAAMKRRWSQAVSGAPSTRTEPGGAGPGSGTLVGAPNVALGPPQNPAMPGGAGPGSGTLVGAPNVALGPPQNPAMAAGPSQTIRMKAGMLLHPNQWHSVHLRAIRRSADRFVSRCYDLDNCEQGSRCWRLDGWP